jgi:hypothetical protein
MRTLCMVVLLLASSPLQNPVPSRTEFGKQQQNQARTSEQPPTTDMRGSEDSPIVVKIIPTPKQEEAKRETEDRKEKSANDRNLVIATYILAGIAALQLAVFGYQAYKLKQTVEAATQQSEDTRRAISETSRSATATEQVARHIETSIQTSLGQAESMQRSVAEAARLASAMEIVAKEIAVSSKAATASVSAISQQMRAYLSVIIGAATYQERARNYKFEARPTLVNAGNTPAHKVSFRAKAAILPVPLPDDFDFPLPDKGVAQAILGPHQNATLGATVDEFCDDGDVDIIKRAEGRGLYIWGIVTYEDVFHVPQYTNFCQIYTWLQDGKTVWGYYAAPHNDAS